MPSAHNIKLLKNSDTEKISQTAGEKIRYVQRLTSDFLKKQARDFPGGAVVKNPPANAGDTSSSPGPGRSHMPWRN